MSIELSTERMNEALRISGYSKSELARVWDKPIRSVVRWFNGTGNGNRKKNPNISVENLFEVCTIMDIDPEYVQVPAADDEFPPYCDRYRLTEQEISNLPEQEKKRVDSDGVYVRHYTKAQMSQHLKLIASVENHRLLASYIQAVIDSGHVENADWAKTHHGCAQMIQHYIGPDVNVMISYAIQDLMKTFPDYPEDWFGKSKKKMEEK